MYCPECGHKVDNKNQKYCTNCGHPFVAPINSSKNKETFTSSNNHSHPILPTEVYLLPEKLSCPYCSESIVLEESERKTGSFICPSCSKEANTESIKIIPKSTTAKSWLLFLGLGCFLGSFNPLVTVIGGITSYDNLAKSAFDTFYFFYCLGTTISLWSIVVLLLLPRRSSFSLWIVLILFIILVPSIIVWLWQQYLLSEGAVLLPGESSWDINGLRGILWLVLWLVYFFRSKYIKENYGDVSIKRIAALFHI
jgi:hypothetical protein